MSSPVSRWPFGRLFLQGQRIDTLVELRGVASAATHDAERTALVLELVRRLGGGLLGPWLATQVPAMAQSAYATESDGSPLPFSALWDEGRATRLELADAYRLLAEVAGYDGAFIERTVAQAVRAGTASPDAEVKRARCAQRSWFAAEADALEGAWHYVATDNDELREILVRIGRERAATAGEPAIATVHLCRVDDDLAFDLKGGRFPRTRFVGHGAPRAVLSRTRGAAPNVHYRLDDVTDLTFSNLKLSAWCTLDMEPDQAQGCQLVVCREG